MKNLKQLTLVALLCYGASIVAAYGFGPGGDMTEAEYNEWLEDLRKDERHKRSDKYHMLMAVNDIYSDFNIIRNQNVSHNDNPQSRNVKNRNEAFDRINYSLDSILRNCSRPNQENQYVIKAIQDTKLFIATNVMRPLHSKQALETFSEELKSYLDRVKALVTYEPNTEDVPYPDVKVAE